MGPCIFHNGNVIYENIISGMYLAILIIISFNDKSRSRPNAITGEQFEKKSLKMNTLFLSYLFGLYLLWWAQISNVTVTLKGQIYC